MEVIKQGVTLKLDSHEAEKLSALLELARQLIEKEKYNISKCRGNELQHLKNFMHELSDAL